MNEPVRTKYSVDELQGNQAYWRALYYFNLYRLLLGTGMMTLAATGADVALLGRTDPLLFFVASTGMLTVAVVSLITITSGWPSFRIQAYLQFSLDAVLITAMSHASGGVDSGLNLLLIASVAAGGVVLSGQMSLFFAAFATLLALAQHTFTILLSPALMAPETFLQVGLLGIGYFSTGLIVYWFAGRFHAVEAAAQAREATTARLDRLNEAIVSKSTVGIVVIGDDRRYRLINDQARIMLGLYGDREALPDDLCSRALELADDDDAVSFDYRSPVTRVRVQVQRIDDQEHEIALFLEDLAQTEREARNLKLAALGRLTAAVAHEIRNPLEAISHAGQLLAESEEMGVQNRKLTGIIENQTNRINNIVKSVLQLGRPGAVSRLSLEVRPWLERFCEHFNAGHGVDNAVSASCDDKVRVQVDPDQLNQILTNLCENALRHSRHVTERPLVTMKCFAHPGTGQICLDVFDRGKGVSEEIRDKIFEPFFTTNHRGLGLGLYLARELAENNGGELDYVSEDGVGRFRLILDHGDRDASKVTYPMVDHG